MTEIRPIHNSEADAFLDLLCEVFGLDSTRARGIFFTEPLFDLSRKWALFEGREMISILTTTPLEFGWGHAFGIAGVATQSNRRGEGHASKLLNRVMAEGVHLGEPAALLFARDPALYERNGFEPVDQVVRCPVEAIGEGEASSLESDSIRRIYDAWASEHPDRLRRGEQRWRYWNWHYRICSPFQSGYLCTEPGLLREALYPDPVDALPLTPGTEWFGLTSMANQLQIPLTGDTSQSELFLMARNVPGVPQMFMTDQF
ncbi:MAG TPA: GNAT family N-acetyltransferase [Fimbriimonas sp.]|nr:GNAT family N-acetyltransferase [Fimbriimonas sp.]